MSDWLESLQAAAAEIAARARASLVAVIQQGRGVGSGVLWAPGWVVTNAHVAGRGPLTVRFNDGSESRAKRRGRDGRVDLAVLEVEDDRGQPARIGDSQALRPGELVLAVGNAWGIPGAATSGVVIESADHLLALGLHLRPGHSGGAVVNARGELVGINTMMNGPDVGLAIPSAEVKRYMARAGLGRLAGGFRRAA